MTITWLLDTNITFASDTLHHNTWVEGASYMLIMLVGADINFLIYALLMLSNAVIRSYPILGVSVGAAIALIWKFNVARAALYRRRDSLPGKPDFDTAEDTDTIHDLRGSGVLHVSLNPQQDRKALMIGTI